MKIPGTFKQKNLTAKRIESSIAKAIRNNAFESGAYYAEVWSLEDCTVIVTREPHGDTEKVFRWHLSISHPYRYPSWDEMKFAILNLIPDENAMMAQILIPERATNQEWVNISENCFHWWEIRDEIIK